MPSRTAPSRRGPQRNAYLRDWRARTASIERRRAVFDMLDVTCWCEREIVRVAPSEVRAGRTSSCAWPWCGPGLLDGVFTTRRAA